MEKDSYRTTGLHRFAVLTASATFFLVIAGGMVTSTDSGLAVPDWPLSYGQLMPPMVGGIFYEHGHRIVATCVGLLTAILCVWVLRADSRRWVKMLGIVALVAVVTQGILGGLTVLFLLPTAISVSHATLAQLFFSLTVFLAVVTSRSWKDAEATFSSEAGGTRRLSVIVSFAILGQLVLGALMRHTGSGLAVPDFPLAYGELWPSFGTESLDQFNRERVGYGLLPVTSVQIAIHMLHRLWAVVVAVLAVTLVRRIFRHHSRIHALREGGIVLFILLAVQVLLGALTVWTGRSVEVATAHVGIGALALAFSVLVAARSFRLLRLQEGRRISQILPPEGVRI